MRDLRLRYTYEQRLEFQDTITVLRQYIVPILKERQKNRCSACFEPLVAFDIDHVLYNPMATLEHIRLLCLPCHKASTNFTPLRYR